MASGNSPTHSSSVSREETHPIPHVSAAPNFPTLFSVNQPISVKLVDNKFFVWQTQIRNIIIASGLEDFVTGNHPCPHAFLGSDPYSSSVSLEHTTWQRYNRLVMSWLYAFISESLLGQIVGYHTVAEIWAALAQIYAAASLSRLLEVQSQLQSLKKNGLTAVAV